CTSTTIASGSPPLSPSASPSLPLFDGVSLVTVSTHDAALQLSTASKSTVTSTSLPWLGRPRIAGVATGPVTAGPVRSATVTSAVAWLKAPFGSVTVSRTFVFPSGYGAAGSWASVNGSPSASEEPPSIDASATHVASAATVTSFTTATGGWFGGSHLPAQMPETVSLVELAETVGRARG